MNNCKYIGLDVHKNITVIVVLNADGQVESRTQVKTKADTLRDFLRGLSGTVHVTFEEGTQSTWLYQLFKPLVTTITVCDARRIQRPNGHKSDDEDAYLLARLLRSGDLQAVYKGNETQQRLKELCRTYENLAQDMTRTQNRLKALYRARGLDCAGQEIYRPERRDEYLIKLTDEAARFRAETLLDQLAALRTLRKQAKQRFLQQARTHPDFKRLLTLPGFGAVRVGQLLATVGTPHRFRTKRQFWPYCGLAVVTQSTADYQEVAGKIVKSKTKTATRGLNHNHHPRLKHVFKGAALTALGKPECKSYYDQLVKDGARPELARVSVARKLAAAALTIWQRQEEYDPTKMNAAH